MDQIVTPHGLDYMVAITGWVLLLMLALPAFFLWQYLRRRRSSDLQALAAWMTLCGVAAFLRFAFEVSNGAIWAGVGALAAIAGLLLLTRHKVS